MKRSRQRLGILLMVLLVLFFCAVGCTKDSPVKEEEVQEITPKGFDDWDTVVDEDNGAEGYETTEKVPFTFGTTKEGKVGQPVVPSNESDAIYNSTATEVEEKYTPYTGDFVEVKVKQLEIDFHPNGKYLYSVRLSEGFSDERDAYYADFAYKTSNSKDFVVTQEYNGFKPEGSEDFVYLLVDKEMSDYEDAIDYFPSGVYENSNKVSEVLRRYIESVGDCTIATRNLEINIPKAKDEVLKPYQNAEISPFTRRSSAYNPVQQLYLAMLLDRMIKEEEKGEDKFKFPKDIVLQNSDINLATSTLQDVLKEVYWGGEFPKELIQDSHNKVYDDKVDSFVADMIGKAFDINKKEFSKGQSCENVTVDTADKGDYRDIPVEDLKSIMRGFLKGELLGEATQKLLKQSLEEGEEVENIKSKIGSVIIKGREQKSLEIILVGRKSCPACVELKNRLGEVIDFTISTRDEGTDSGYDLIDTEIASFLGIKYVPRLFLTMDGVLITPLPTDVSRETIESLKSMY